MEWRTIDSAPRDGTWILLAGGGLDEDDYADRVGSESLSRPSVGRWGYEDYNLGTNKDDELWEVAYWDGDWRTHYVNPTHWASLEGAPR